MKGLFKYIFPLMLTLVVMVFFYLNIQIANRNASELTELAKINNTYHQANSCIITTEPDKRTIEFKNACYDRAEKANGVTVERFGVESN